MIGCIGPLTSPFLPAALARFREQRPLIEATVLRINNRARGVPAVAAEGLWQFGIAPVRDVVVFDGGFLTEKALDEVVGVVEDEDYWLGIIARELRDFLRGELICALAGE